LRVIDIAQLAQIAMTGGSAGCGFYVVRWIALFLTGRHDARQARLDREHAELDQGWKGIRLTLEQRVERLEKQNAALHVAFQHVSAALIRHAPDDPALKIAEQVMARAFPTDFTLAASMAGAAIDRQGGMA
jgi:hypothetical protein